MCRTFHTPKRNTHTYQREREIQRERSKEGKEARVVLARVVGYESENVRKFFLFFFARQRGESKLERDSEMVRR